MALYLLHSTVPLVRANGQVVRHYLGFCEEGGLPRRLRQHDGGRKSSRLTKAMLAAGATFLLGNYFPGLTRTDERRMKKNGHLSSKCLVCKLKEAVAALDALDGHRSPSGDMFRTPSTARGSSSPRQNGALVREKTGGS